MDCSPPGSSVHGILHVRILEWVTIPFSRESSQPRGSNPRLLHCRQILYSLSHLGSHVIVSKALSNWTPDYLSSNFMFTVQQEHSGLFQFTELANCLFSLRAFELILLFLPLYTPNLTLPSVLV